MVIRTMELLVLAQRYCYKLMTVPRRQRARCGVSRSHFDLRSDDVPASGVVDFATKVV